MRTPLALGLLTGLAFSAAAAHAGNDIGVIVTGESWIQPQLAAQIESWLTQHGHTLVPAQLAPEDLDALHQCFASRDEACARNILGPHTTATGIIYARADSKARVAGTPDVTLTAYWLDKGHGPIGENRICPRCTDQSLRTTADDVLKKLIGGADLGHAKLKSNPPGARITIDGQPIGVTPLDWDLPPGKHTIQMDTPGHKSQSQAIGIESNKSRLVVMTLPPEGSDHDRGTTLPRWVPLAATITGGAALVAGGALIVFGRPDPDERYYNRTWPAGIGVATGGAIIGGLGAYWLLFRSPGTTSSPVASFTSDTAYLGWLGRF